MRRVIYVAGCGHSGSTAFEKALCVSRDCIGMGEVYQLVKRGEGFGDLSKYPCSCSQTIATCKLWEKAIPVMFSKPAGSLERYLAAYDELYKQYGESKFIVDSSKVLEPIDIFSKSEVDVVVIHLVRDVRAWIRAMKKGLKRTQVVKNTGIRASVKRFLRSSTIYLAHEWYFTNLKVEASISKHGFRAILVGYEPFCFETKRTINEVHDFVGISDNCENLDLTFAVTHNVLGNRMRLNKNKSKSISYDFNWLAEGSGWWINMIPYIARANRKWVYGSEC